ncbi:hypothetical protein B0H13DRAFT_1526525, partial [Mycena leptocephala]
SAAWLQPDEKKLIEYLVEHQAAAGDGTDFKAFTFRGAAIHVNSTRTKGGPNSGKSCEQKYRALRRDWGFVNHIKGVSGFSWSDEHGANISAASQGAWDALVAVNPKAARFRSKGWPFYNLLAPLMPSKATGGNV